MSYIPLYIAMRYHTQLSTHFRFAHNWLGRPTARPRNTYIYFHFMISKFLKFTGKPGQIDKTSRKILRYPYTYATVIFEHTYRFFLIRILVIIFVQINLFV